MKRYIILILMLFATHILFAQQKGNKKQNQPDPNRGNMQEQIFYTDVPSHDYDIILARPTANSVTLSILSYKPAEAFITFSKPTGDLEVTEIFGLQENKVFEVVLKNLKTDSKYTYNFLYKVKGAKDFTKSPNYYFHTQRSKAGGFVFTITADSHLDQNTDTSVYRTTLVDIVSDSADFHIDLGDTYMTDKYKNNYQDALKQYIAQRYYFGLISHSSPLFSVLGNHDGESGNWLNDRDENMTVWANRTRKSYFPNPVPDGFYSGNDAKEPFVDLPQNYYSWEWGNTLFIVLDPFWFTTREGADDPWERTLGKKQYDWLKKTLETSHAKFKFVFIHNLVGGVDIKGRARGGAEAATFYEWGGQNLDGTAGFKAHRVGWEMPIHDLLKKHKVSAVFHGHDHVFAKQDLDGIVYQCLPQPGAARTGNMRQAEEYGYKGGIIMNAPGYMRVKVTVNTAVIEYIASKNKEILYSYTFRAE